MPICPMCDCELEEDAVFGVFYCWRCAQPYKIDDDGYLVYLGPGTPVTDVNVAGHLL